MDQNGRETSDVEPENASPGFVLLTLLRGHMPECDRPPAALVLPRPQALSVSLGVG